MKKLIMILVSFLFLLASLLSAQSGTIDSTFGSNGAATYTDIGQRPEAHSILLLPNGDMITLGHRQNGFGSQLQMLGYHLDGTRNIDFGGDNLFGNPTWGYPGIINTDFVNLVWEHITTSAVQSDGKIVVGGYAGNNFDWLIARYKADGSVDSTFNAIGYISEDEGGFESVSNIYVDGQDNIIVFGTANKKMRFIKYLADGSIDTSFGINGLVVLGEENTSSNDMCSGPNGEFYFVGSKSASGETTIITGRILTNGVLDQTFGISGFSKVVTAGINSSKIQLALTPNDQIFITADAIPGFSNESDLLMLKLHPNGSLDVSFGNAGTIILSMGDHVSPYDMLIQSNGKILIAGRLAAENVADMFVSKFNADGSFDLDFGNDGTGISGFAADLSNSSASAYAMCQQPDGKIMLGGMIKELGIQKSAMVRFNNAVDTNYSNTTNHTQSPTLKVYPNPVISDLIVNVPLGKWHQMTIFNAQGNDFHKQLISTDENDIILPITLLERGISIIQLSGKSESIYSKVIRP